eukprot:gene19402-21325_t
MTSTPSRNYAKTPKKTPMRREKYLSKDQDPVEVYCRVRPVGRDDEESCVEVLNDQTIQLNPPKFSKAGAKIDNMQCTFKRIFEESVDQQEVFQTVAMPLIDDLINGKNGLVFMYGITGSGKTHTMSGVPSNAGLLPRCLDVLFNSIEQVQTKRCVFKSDSYNNFDLLSDNESNKERERKEKELALAYQRSKKDNGIGDGFRIPDTTKIEVNEDNNYTVFISYVEIYNNFIYDLLDDSQMDAIRQGPPVSKGLREDANKNMYVYQGIEVEVKRQSKRRVAHTQLNAESSRSHSVFTIRLVQVPLDSSGARIVTDREYVAISQLSLCDLAGSERSKRTDNGGDRLREAGNINASLMTLRQCIEALRENQKAYENNTRPQIVPYRDTKLTHLFKRHFEGDGKVRMVVCLNPSPGDFDESLHVMRFAEATQEVKVQRSDAVRFDLGLTPGRGKVHRHYKQVIEDLNEVKEESEHIDIPLLTRVQRFLPFPSLELTSAEDTTTLANLINYLQSRITLRNTLLREQTQREERLREMIGKLEDENKDFCKLLSDQKSAYSEKDREIQTLEKRVRTLQQKFETSQRTITTMDKERRSYEMEAEKFKKAYEKEKHEKHKVKQMLRDFQDNQNSKWESECNKRVRAKQLEMDGKVYEKSEKLRQLREIVQNFDSPIRNQINIDIDDDDVILPPQPAPQPVPKTPQHHHHHYYRSKTVEKKAPPPVAKKPTRVRSKTVTSDVKPRSKSPPANLKRNERRDPPIRSKHRRSRSTDCILMHKPVGTLNTDTVMQPVVRNKKTVIVPKIGDLKDPINYMLTHQEEDSAGEIETKLYKGQVMKTRTGGHSVQFTDVEMLKHRYEAAAANASATPGKDTESSGSDVQGRGRKRLSCETEEEQTDESVTDVETRCAAGIGGGPRAEHSNLLTQAKLVCNNV